MFDKVAQSGSLPTTPTIPLIKNITTPHHSTNLKLKIMKKVCLECQESFLPKKRNDQLYCSHSCKQAAYIKRKVATMNNTDESVKEKIQNTNKVEIPFVKVENGRLFDSIKCVKRTEQLFVFCHSMLWSTKDFPEDQQNNLKRLIAEYFKESSDVDETFKHLVEKIVLAKRYVLEKPYRFMAEPKDWLNIKFMNGLRNTSKWHDALQEQRKTNPKFGESLKIFSEAILNYAEQRNVLDIVFYRQALISLEAWDLLQWYMNFVMHYQFINY
jgi:hypothetical protein